MSDLGPILHGARPPVPLAAAKGPDLEDVRELAAKMTVGLLPGGSPSPPPPGMGLGLQLDIYDTVGLQGLGALSGRSAETLAEILNGDFARGLATAGRGAPPPDFPYMEPLGPTLGQVFDALI
jgi:hypothetical protein